MIRKFNNNSLVYAILVALKKGSNIVIVNEYTMSIRFKGGYLNIISPYRTMLTRMFKLTNESSSKLSDGIDIYNQTYVLDDNLIENKNDFNKLISHYEVTYLV